MLVDKIVKIAKQDNVLNCIDPARVDVEYLIVIRRRMKSYENWLLTHQRNRLLHTLTRLKDIKPVLGITMVSQDYNRRSGRSFVLGYESVGTGI